MAGLDGIKNKIDPGEAMDKDLYDLPPEELEGIPTVLRRLREAMDSLEADTTSCWRAMSSPKTRSKATWSSSGKRSTPSSTRRIRSSSRCTTAAEPSKGRQMRGALRGASCS